MIYKKIIRILFILGSFLVQYNLWAADTLKLEDLKVIALSPLDGRAVVALPGGTMQVLKIGEGIPNTQATVQQVLPDKLVVQETIQKNKSDSPRIQTVWIYKPTKAGAPSRVERLDTQGPPAPLQARPVVKTLSDDNAAKGKGR